MIFLYLSDTHHTLCFFEFSKLLGHTLKTKYFFSGVGADDARTGAGTGANDARRGAGADDDSRIRAGTEKDSMLIDWMNRLI